MQIGSAEEIQSIQDSIAATKEQLEASREIIQVEDAKIARLNEEIAKSKEIIAIIKSGGVTDAAILADEETDVAKKEAALELAEIKAASERNTLAAANVSLALDRDKLALARENLSASELELEIVGQIKAIREADANLTLAFLRASTALREDNRDLEADAEQERIDHQRTIITIERGSAAARKDRIAQLEEELATIQAQQFAFSLTAEDAKILTQDQIEAKRVAEFNFFIQKKINDLLRNRGLTQKEINALAEEGLQRNQQLQEQLIRFAGQQLQAVLSGDAGVGGFVSGLAGIAGSAIEGPLGVAVSVGSGILASLFEGPAEDLSDSLDTNTQAIDRNTQTLQDVFEQRIGVPTSFALPAAIARQGALQGSVGNTTINQSVAINVNGAGQNAEQLAPRIATILTRELNVDRRRGFGTNIFSLG